MDYLPETEADIKDLLEEPQKAVISRYALGRDYHKMMRRRLQQLANRKKPWLKRPVSAGLENTPT